MKEKKTFNSWPFGEVWRVIGHENVLEILKGPVFMISL